MLYGQSRKLNNPQTRRSDHLKFSFNILTSFILAAVFALSGCVVHHHGHGYKQNTGSNFYTGVVKVKPRVAVTVPAPVTFTFTNHHRHKVLDYYRHHPHHHGTKHKWKKKWKNQGRRHIPPGLRKRDVLPPGILMQGIPVDLDRQLPQAPRGTRYIYHNEQILLIDVNTRVVLDFINISVSTVY